MRLWLASLLATAVVTGGSLSRASAQARCEDTFSTRASVLSRQAVDERPKLLRKAAHRALPEWVRWLEQREGASRQRRLDRMIESFDPASRADRARLDKYVTTLMIELYGPRTRAASWLRSRDSRLEKQALDLVREKVLREGLRALVEMTPVHHRERVDVRLKTVYHRFTSSHLGKWLGFPLRLPQLENVEMPKELFEKILADGYDAHAKDFESLIGRRQTGIDAYNTFARVYGVAISAALLLYFQFDTRTEVVQQVEAEAHAVAVREAQNLEQTGVVVKALGAPAREAIREKALQRALTDFRAKWGEEPTPEELQSMKQKIWSRL